MITQTQTHTERIKQELHDAGMSHLAMLSFTARFLPNVIHKDEHIEAIVFGRHKEAEGIAASIEGILVATNKRIIYLDHKPGFTTMDEVSYEVVSGARISASGFRSSLTLFTKVANYTISFAKPSNVEKFANYIESKRLDTPQIAESVSPTSRVVLLQKTETLRFLRSHDIAVLSTIEHTGGVTAAPVYYLLEGGFFYLITKETTRKSRNMMANPQVAITIYDADKMQVAQIKGIAEIEPDPNISNFIYQKLTQSHYQGGKEYKAPSVEINNGRFIVFRIRPTECNFSDFS